MHRISIKDQSLWLVVLLGILMFGPILRGQEVTGSLSIRALDPAQAQVGGAQLALTNAATGHTVTGETHSDGSFVFNLLQPGTYQLVVTANGFNAAQFTNINVNIGESVSVTANLTVGSVSQSVSVSAQSSSLLNSQSAAVGQTINRDLISQLPLNGRNFVQLAQLTTGAQPIGGGNSNSTTWTGRTDTTIILGGLRESDVSYLVNGIETRNPRFGNTGIRPSIDAIDEFRVQRTTFGPEFGRSAAVVNLDLRAGSNALHGDIFNLNRNRDYAANDYFLNKEGLSRPPFNQNNFGATMAGPVSLPKVYDGKNRSYFMFNYEGFRQVQGEVLTGIYPSVAQLAGNLADDSAGTGIYPLNSGFCGANAGSLKCANIINPATGIPYPGNVIPAAQFDPIDQKALPYIPHPNVQVSSGAAFPSYNTIASPSIDNNWDQYNARLDQIVTSRDTVYATFSNSNEHLTSPSIQPLGGSTFPLADHLWTATYVHIFTANVSNEFRFGLNNSVTFLNPQTAYGPDYATTVFGLKNTNDNPLTFGVPDFSIAGLGAIGSWSETIGAQDITHQFTDNVAISKGRHDLTAGVQFIHEHFSQNTDFGANPGFTFDGRFSGTSASGFGLGDFLLGAPYQASGSAGDSQQYLHTNYYGFYTQDKWQMTPTLVLNLGLRYEYSGSPIESRNHSAYFDINTGQELLAGIGIRRSIIKPDFTNFAPRLGFAWKPSFAPNTVLRGGWGIYYATDSLNEEQFKIVGSPFYQSQTLNSNPTTPTISMENMLPEFATSTNLNPFTMDENDRTPYIEQWGLDLQQVLFGKYLFELEYAGGEGHHLPQRRNANIATIDPTGTIPIAERVPFPAYGYILQTSHRGNSNYDALTAKMERRFENGLSFLASYTFSKAIDLGDTGDDASAISRDFGLYDRGVSDYSVPNRVVVSAVYDLPFGKGRHFLSTPPAGVNYLVGGWQLNTITTFTGGQYSTAVLPNDYLNIGSFTQSRPNIDRTLLSVGRHLPTQYLNPAAFTYPSTHVEGNVGRNTIEQPGYQNWDSSLFKSIPIHENIAFQLRFEFFNAFNHTQFGYANTTLGPGFGEITSIRPPRIIQLGGRLQW
jgi:hypothetical protein